MWIISYINWYCTLHRVAYNNKTLSIILVHFLILNYLCALVIKWMSSYVNKKLIIHEREKQIHFKCCNTCIKSWNYSLWNALTDIVHKNMPKHIYNSIKHHKYSCSYKYQQHLTGVQSNPKHLHPVNLHSFSLYEFHIIMNTSSKDQT